MDPIDAALEALKSLDIGEKPNYSQIAKKYGVDRNKLSRRFRGVQGSRAAQYENQQLLNNVQELELVKYIDKLCGRGLPPTKQMIRNFAQEISGKQPGRSWVDRYIARHNIELISR